MYKKAKILFFCTIFVASAIFCQKPNNFLTHYSATKFLFLHQKNNLNRNFYKNEIVVLGESEKLKAITNSMPFIVSSNYYSCNFSFFCKQELRFEKSTKIPLRFRLGSLQYNDYLEKKPNAIINY